MTYLSSKRVILGRIILVGAGFLAVLAGGMGFPHYLIIMYSALVIAFALPVNAGAQLLPVYSRRAAISLGIAAGIIGLFVFGPAARLIDLATPSQIVAGFSKESVPKDRDLAKACPAGSNVLVWGWAPELYSYYSWHNTVPFINVLVVTASDRNVELARPIMEAAVADSDCIVDAIGDPFFHFATGESLDDFFPTLSREIDGAYVERDRLIDCDDCRIFVRN
jgi:hypothetical protein